MKSIILVLSTIVTLINLVVTAESKITPHKYDDAVAAYYAACMFGGYLNKNNLGSTPIRRYNIALRVCTRYRSMLLKEIRTKDGSKRARILLKEIDASLLAKLRTIGS